MGFYIVKLFFRQFSRFQKNCIRNCNLSKIMDGNLDEVIDALATREQAEKLQKLGG